MMMSNIIFRLIQSEEDLQLAFDVRTQVFVNEQKFAQDIEIDQYDRAQGTDHFLALDTCTNQPIATVRVFPSENPGIAMLGRLACLPSYRGQGIGKKLMVLAHDQLRNRRKFHSVHVHSQLDKEQFYLKIGYSRTSQDVFMEEGAPHVYMTMDL